MTRTLSSTIRFQLTRSIKGVDPTRQLGQQPCMGRASMWFCPQYFWTTKTMMTIVCETRIKVVWWKAQSLSSFVFASWQHRTAAVDAICNSMFLRGGGGWPKISTLVVRPPPSNTSVALDCTKCTHQIVSECNACLSRGHKRDRHMADRQTAWQRNV